MSDPLSLLASACCSTPAHPPTAAAVAAAAATAGSPAGTPSSSHRVDHYQFPAGSTSSSSRSKSPKDSTALHSNMSVRLPSCASLVAPVNAATTREISSRHGPSPSATPFQDEQQWHSPTLRAGLQVDSGPYSKDASHASLARYALCSHSGTSPNLGGGPSYSASLGASAPSPDPSRSDSSACPIPTSPRARRRTDPSAPVDLAALPSHAPLARHDVGATGISNLNVNRPAWPSRHAEATRLPLDGVVAADFARPHGDTSSASTAVDSISRTVGNAGRSPHLDSVPVYPGSNHDYPDSRRDQAPSRSYLESKPKAEAERRQAEAGVETGAGSSNSLKSLHTANDTHPDAVCKAEPMTPSPAAVDELADESGTASGSQGEGSIADRPPCAKPKKELKGSKRAEQNRAAQRAFRERKEQKLRNLQELVGRIPELEGQVSSLSSQCALLEADCASHQRERQNFNSERASWDRERRSLFGEIDALRRVLSVEQATMPHQATQAGPVEPRPISPSERERDEPTSLSASSSMSPREMQSGGETEDGSRRLGSVDTASTALEDDEVAVLHKEVKREAPDDFAQQEMDKRFRPGHAV